MYVYIDESGTFHSGVNTICSIIIPDTIKDYVRRKFRDFEKNISSEEFIHGEVKGCNLSYKTRIEFFKFLNQYEEIKITPASIDLDIQPQRDVDEFFNKVYKGYAKAIAESISKKDEIRRSELAQLLKMYKKDRSLFIHQFMLINNIFKTIEHLLVFYLDKRYDFCFEHISIIIDKKQPRELTDYEKLTKRGLPYFFHNLSKGKPVGVVSDVWGPEHPFRKNYECKEGIMANDLLKDVSFKNSREEFGLRMTDIITNSLYKCLRGDFSAAKTSSVYKGIVNNISTGSKIGPYFILMGDEDQEKIKVPRKYLKFYQY